MAQTIIEGSLLDQKGKVVEAYVTVALPGEGSIVSYGDADAKGHYRLEFTADADSVVVTASGLDIGNQSKTVTNRSQRLDFRVRQQALTLKEVTVKAEKIRQSGDTLNYLVGAYQQQSDRTIGDVLKRMPGIEVSDNGGIKFNGKSISKFYVEDMDLLQGRYGLATNNVNAQDVAKVQVLENHQPVKALQGRALTDDVAINLKLKDKAKGTVAVNAMVGGGAQQKGSWRISTVPIAQGQTPVGRNPLWSAEFVGMYFASKQQNMTLYKGNNTGDDVSAELTSHYGTSGVQLYPFCPMAALMPSGSGLPQQRTFDNNSHIVTTNHLEKLSKDAEVTVNIAYYADRIRREETSDADRFVNDGSRLLSSETLTSETHLHNLNAQLRYCNNAANGFTANVLKFSGAWNSDDVLSSLASSLTGATPVNYGDNHVSQHFHRPQFSVSNTLNTIRNYGKNTLDLHFAVGYGQRPNTLSVGIDSLLQRSSAAYVQDLTSRHIAARAYTQYDLHLGAFTLNYGISANANLHQVETSLDGFLSEDITAADDMRNDLWYNVCEVALNQFYKYEQGGWRLSLGCPLELYAQSLDDRLRREKNSHTRLLVMPSLSASCEWWDWSGNVNASYSKTVGDPGGIYSGYIMNNYRSFTRSFIDHLSETDRMTAGATLAYRSAITATFFRLNANYDHTRDNQIYGYTFHGATTVVQAINRPTHTDQWSIGFDGSKGFDWLQTTVRAFGGYNYRKSEQIIGGELYPFHSTTTSLGLGGTVTPLPWLNIVLSSGFAWNVAKTEDASQTTIRTSTQRIKVNAYVTKRLTLTASAEDNYNNLTARDRHAWFGDLSAKYKLKHVDLELCLANVFDQRQYTHVSYSALDIYSQTSQLRPRNLLLTVRFKVL